MTSLKLFAAPATLLLAVGLVPAQQATTPQMSADAAKKHPAGVKYSSITMKSTDPNDPKAQQPHADSSQSERRKNGAIIAADFNKKQASAPGKDTGSAVQPQETHSPGSPAGKGIGSAGIPGKSVAADSKAHPGQVKSAVNRQDQPKK